MRFTLLSLCSLVVPLALSLSAAEPASAEPATVPVERAPSEASPVQRELQALISRQQRLFTDAARENNPNFDEDNFKQRTQELLFDYEAFLKRNPELAAGYASFGFFLSKIDMQKQSISMLLKANKLDPDLPLVKNQIGNYLAEEGKVIEASTYYTAAIKLAPEEPLYHYQLGMLLHEGRDLFVKSGQWTAAAVERSSFNAFKRAAELAPNRIEFTYRACEAYYDLSTPRWEEALAAWAGLQEKVSLPLEKQTMALHRANILMKMNKMAEARELLATVSEAALSKQKEKLIAELPENRKQ